MINAIAVDPGLRGCGVAWCEGVITEGFYRPGTLRGAVYARREHGKDGYTGWVDMATMVRLQVTLAWGCRPGLVIVERPQVYPGARALGDPEDLLALMSVAVLAADYLAQLGTTVTVLRKPAEWKGQVDKVVHHARIQAALNPEERVRIVLPQQKALQHNVWDAVGLAKAAFALKA